jgi:5'-nucleotidase/UDP-sugar diphosphatase
MRFMRTPRRASSATFLLTLLALLIAALAPAVAAPGGNGRGHEMGNGRGDGLPPGLAKRAELPPGLADRDELPPGLEQSVVFELTVLHNNDGESALLPDGDVGGVARFATLVDRERADALADATIDEEQGVVLISSGDNYLASPALAASRANDFDPFYDAVALDMIGYDAMVVGNHEFDLGPAVLHEFISQFGVHNPAPPFLSANLDTTGTVLDGDIAPYAIVEENGRRVGIIGATTPELRTISSPGDVDVLSDVAGIIQGIIDELEADGVNIIILSSHLQSANLDIELIGQLSGVDIAIAGGGDELLANADDLLIPGSEVPFGPYPLTAETVDGVTVPVITTPGDYLYLGRLDARFDDDGDLVSYDGGPVRNVGTAFDDGVEADTDVEEAMEPVADFIAALDATVIGTSAVFLNAERPDIRVQETNLGNLMADALLYEATQAGFSPDVAIQNGGGVRASIDTGDITLAETFTTAPFPNFVVVFDEVTPVQLKSVLERSVSAVENVSGRFAHVSGMSYTFDLSGTAQVQDEDGNITVEGGRIVSVVLDDGTVIVDGGAVVAGAPSVSLATIDFLANGGDGYPYPVLGLTEFEGTGFSYQQALQDFIIDGLGGTVSDGGPYAPGGEGRITQVN